MKPVSLRHSCPSCGNEYVYDLGDLAPGVRFAGRLLDTPLPGGRLYECPQCHLVFRHPVLPKETLDELYRNSNPETWQYPPARRRDWSSTRRWLEQHYTSGSVLDVGCADGAFLNYLGNGWEAFGIEMGKDAAQRAQARGIQILGADAAMLPTLQRQFDVVVAYDLIEHMADPRTLLEQMAARTRPGGAVVIGSGDTQAWSWKLMGSRYWYCALPEHLAFINEDWCRSAADGLGLRLAHVERYVHTTRRPPGRIISQLAKNLLFRFFPHFFGWLRTRGIGGIDVSEHPAWQQVPPPWTTAKDHLLAIFQKP